jgi:hypothetical protein
MLNPKPVPIKSSVMPPPAVNALVTLEPSANSILVGFDHASVPPPIVLVLPVADVGKFGPAVKDMRLFLYPKGDERS